MKHSQFDSQFHAVTEDLEENPNAEPTRIVINRNREFVDLDQISGLDLIRSSQPEKNDFLRGGMDPAWLLRDLKIA